MKPLIAALGLTLVGAAVGVAAAPTPLEPEKPDLRLSIASPANGAIVGDPGGMAFISGRAMALFGEFQTFDIVFVIDTSDSTSAPSGADVDGDGKVGKRRGAAFGILGAVLPQSTDAGDSILAAEVAAVQTMLDQLDPRTTRVGVVAFAGDHDALTPDAYTVVPLTSDYRRVKRGLKSILSDGPSGLTNMVTAVNLATVELMGTQTAYSERRTGSKRIMMFLTDGAPTLPIDSSRIQNARMTIAQAVRASKLDIRIDTFAIGEDALSEPVVVVEMARVSRGIFTPVVHPGDLKTVFEEVNFAEIEALEIRNQTTGAVADYVTQNADGTYSALLPMEIGENLVEVYARSTNQTEARRQITVTFLPNAPAQELSPRLLAQRNRLLENRLLDLQRRRLQIQTERDDEIRKELRREIESERAKAEERAAERRRELEIEVEDQE